MPYKARIYCLLQKFQKQKGRQYLSALTGVLGFEPRNAGTKTRCLTAWRHPIVTLAILAASYSKMSSWLWTNLRICSVSPIVFHIFSRFCGLLLAQKLGNNVQRHIYTCGDSRRYNYLAVVYKSFVGSNFSVRSDCFE